MEGSSSGGWESAGASPKQACSIGWVARRRRSRKKGKATAAGVYKSPVREPAKTAWTEGNAKRRKLASLPKYGFTRTSVARERRRVGIDGGVGSAVGGVGLLGYAG